MRIFLIGYMGSGKSTLGKMIAEKTNSKFIDTDDLIVAKEGLSCAEIIKTKGEEYFRKTEQEVLASVCYMAENATIATGGGMPCFHDNMEQMNASGKTIYLNWTPNALAERLMTTDLSTRPMLQGKTNEQLTELIIEQLGKRNPYYEKAHIIIQCDGLSEEQAATEIISTAAH